MDVLDIQLCQCFLISVVHYEYLFGFIAEIHPESSVKTTKKEITVTWNNIAYDGWVGHQEHSLTTALGLS